MRPATRSRTLLMELRSADPSGKASCMDPPSPWISGQLYAYSSSRYSWQALNAQRSSRQLGPKQQDQFHNNALTRVSSSRSDPTHCAERSSLGLIQVGTWREALGWLKCDGMAVCYHLHHPCLCRVRIVVDVLPDTARIDSDCISFWSFAGPVVSGSCMSNR